MEDPLLSLLNVCLVIFLVILNGLFVAAEFAIVSAQHTKLNNEFHKNKFGWKSANYLVEHLELSLSSTQLGITIASLVLGWWGEQSLADLFLSFFKELPTDYRLIFSHGLATAIALLIVTFLHVVLGELAAKSLAIRYPEITLRTVAPVIHLFTRACKPALSFLNWCANKFLRVFGLTAVAESVRVHTPSELAMLVSHSTERGELDKDEEEMLKGVFSFSNTVAREVMTPRTNLVTIPADASLDLVLETLVKSGFSRIPVTEESVDRVTGILLARDILPFLHAKLLGSKREFDLRSILREPYFIPETKPVDDLLNELKGRKVHMAIVLDEHGGVDGVVTLEDLVEEIVGEIFDESDVAEAEVVVERNGDLILDASMLVSDVNSEFAINIPEGDYDTLSGFMFTLLGRVPEVGDQIAICRSSRILVNGVDQNVEEEVRTEEVLAIFNGQGSIREQLESEDKPLLILLVEEVSNNRIEHIRLIRSDFLRKFETQEEQLASKHQVENE